MKRRIWKIILFSIPFLIVIVIFAILASIKINNGYQASIYNYESYLSPKVVKKIKQYYNYKEFKEVNEFSQALYAERTIAGIGSDFQAAQLIIDNKIKKINFELIFGKGANEWEKRKLLYRSSIVKHMEKFDNLIYETIKNKNHPTARILSEKDKTYDVNGDGIPDHFYEYILPYYSQDKGVALSLDKKNRPHLDKIENTLKDLKNKDFKLTWEELIRLLRKHNYQRFGWTNAYYDNLMIGSSYQGNKPYNIFNEKNYKQAIDAFVKFVNEVGGHNIKNTEYNYFSNDGLELLNHLIEPKEKRSDAAVLYNGDALDAYYSKDNFSLVKNGSIKFIRPKDNYMLMDGWILSKRLDNKETERFLNLLKQTIYSQSSIKNISNQLRNLENNFFSQFKKYLSKKIIDDEKEFVKIRSKQLGYDQTISLKKINEFLSALNENNFYKILKLRNSDLHYFSRHFDKIFEENLIDEIINFNYISYTPTDNLMYKFFEKWYFSGDKVALEIYKQRESYGNYNLSTYPIIDNNLRTKIATYYYEVTKS
ncbi:hypothetical protein [Metamycoplasma buccale]|uniref:hypothetical protein n=1 Tax=Metamycoplasma buccale TaxID=55602 RepID=UPI00398F0AAA